MHKVIITLATLSLLAHAEVRKAEPPKATEIKPEVKKGEVKKPEAVPTKVELKKPEAAVKGDAKSEAAPAFEVPKDSSKAETPKDNKGPKATVLKWDKKRDRIAVSDDPVHAWARKDNVCVYRLGRAIACGKVIAVGINGAVVQLLSHAAAVKPGDEAHYFEPERKIPQITDEEMTSEKLMESYPMKYGISVGAFLGLDLLYPVLTFYLAVSPNVSVGFQPAYIKKTGELTTSTLSGFGGLLTVNYFGDEYFRGLWLELGSGFYHLNAEQTGTSESINAPCIVGLVGWHEDWAHGLNLGAGIGARFLSPLQKVTDPTYSSLHPIAHVEVGFSF